MFESASEEYQISMNAIPAASSSAHEAESGLAAASTSVESVAVAAPTAVTAPAPVVASAPASNASASVASSSPNAAGPDSHHSLVTSPTSAPPSAAVPSVTQAALALATALRDAGPSISNEILVSEIVTAFIRAGPKTTSGESPLRNSTESVMHAINIDLRLKELEIRIDLAIAKFDISLLKVSAEQKRLENLVKENIK